jgi:hypothetical protein
LLVVATMRSTYLFDRHQGVAERLDIAIEYQLGDGTKPVAAQFRPAIAFLGYDPSPEPMSLAERPSMGRGACRARR